MPILAAVVFWRRKYMLDYAQTYRKCVIHVHALGEGPALHYFTDVAGLEKQVPEEIHGSCVQCGNCCMERRCLFLEPLGGGKYGCGIYTSYWRKYSNCSSFPLSQHDIDRYACPSYFIGKVIPIQVR
jgi:hypothetical protein